MPHQRPGRLHNPFEFSFSTYTCSCHFCFLALSRLFVSPQRLSKELVYSSSTGRILSCCSCLAIVGPLQRITPFDTLYPLNTISKSADYPHKGVTLRRLYYFFFQKLQCNYTGTLCYAGLRHSTIPFIQIYSVTCACTYMQLSYTPTTCICQWELQTATVYVQQGAQ